MSDVGEIGRQYWSFLLAIVAGLLISFLTADQQSWPIALIRLFVGAAFAVLFTSPIIDLLGREPAIWRDAVAALLAMSGYVIARMINKLKWSLVIDLVSAFRRGR